MKIIKVLIPVWMLFMSGIFISGCNSQTEQSGQTENHANADEHGAEEAQLTEEAGEHLEEGEESTEVHLTKEQLVSLNIKVDTLNAGSASSVIQRPANVMYDMDRIAKVGPRIEAKVVSVLKDLGDYVEKGDPIARMSSVGLGKIKADYIRLRAGMKRRKLTTSASKVCMNKISPVRLNSCRPNWSMHRLRQSWMQLRKP